MAISEVYQRLDAKRAGVLTRARECARLTIPSVLPPAGWTEGQTLETPYQSIGARGVNQLVSKLLLVLLPANVPFFKLEIAPEILNSAGISKDQADILLAAIEKRIMKLVEELNLRATLATALRDLVVTGNSLIYFGKDNVKVFKLEDYVVQRDGAGNVKTLITREKLSKAVLPRELRSLLEKAERIKQEKPDQDPAEVEEYTLYTMAVRDGDKWTITQEIEDIPVKQVTVNDEDFPYIILRWSSAPNESYGRGLVEQYLGDLKSLEALYEALVSGALQSSRVIWLVRPNSVLTPENIEKAWNGDVLVGSAEDVSAVQLNKYADFNWILQMVTVLEQRLAQVFFLIPGSIRDAERVTAEEIRLISQELETSLGGVYTLLTNELQRPMLRLLLKRLKSEAGYDLSKYKSVLDIKIITGFAGIGRTEDFNRLLLFVQSAAGVPEAGTLIDSEKILRQMAVSLGVDPSVVRSRADVLREQLQLQAQSVAAQGMAGMMLQQMGGVPNEAAVETGNNPEEA